MSASSTEIARESGLRAFPDNQDYHSLLTLFGLALAKKNTSELYCKTTVVAS